MPCSAADESEISLGLFIVIVCLLIVQTLLIVGLQRSRLKNKATKNLLALHKKELELKVHERTQSLHQKNLELELAINDQQNIALQLQETKRHLQTIINSVADILVGVNTLGIVTYWNNAASDKTGVSFEQALGKNISSVLPQLPVSDERLLNIIESRKPFINQHIHQVEKEGSKFYDLRIYPLIGEPSNSHEAVGAVIQLIDVSKRVQLENMMIQNEKMSSLGELAAGIAHEINNPLGIILHNVQNIIRRTLPNLPSNIKIAEEHNIHFDQISRYFAERDIPQFLDNIKSAGERAGKIVANMLEFSHGNHSEKSWVDIHKLLIQSVELNRNASFVERKKMAAVQVATKFNSDFPLVFGSAAELQQVFLNLLRNAYQALTTDDYQKPEELRVTISTYTKNSEAVIEISDNGPGIKDNVKDHIFEPFFTTKEIGKGTGLGLSVTYFIIAEHHQGHINVISQPGKGATFKIRLPITGDRQISLDI